MDSFAAVQLVELARMRVLGIIAPHIFTENNVTLLKRLIQDYTESMPRGAYDEALYHIIEGGRRTFLNALQTWRKEMDPEAKMPRCAKVDA